MLNRKCAQRFGLDPQNRKKWPEAEDDCVSKGGHLASAANPAELKATWKFCFENLKEINHKTDCAVGLRQAKDGAFYWTDGQTFNSELEEETYMGGHRADYMHIEGRYAASHAFLEGEKYRDMPFLYVCGTSLPSFFFVHIHWLEIGTFALRSC